jgi:hypothetical protein
MRRTRALLFGLTLALVVLAGARQVSAIPCIPCICNNECNELYNNCLAGCDGNGSCETGCRSSYTACELRC